MKIYIDGSAKGNHIGAGLVVVQDQQAIHRDSFHKALERKASSSMAEFWALRKCLEWIDENQPLENITILTDSQEVSQRPIHQAPSYVIRKLHHLSWDRIQLIQAKNKPNPWILEAHDLSREYLKHHSIPTPLSSVQHIPRKSLISISLLQEEGIWIARNENHDILENGDHPIEVLYQAIKLSSLDSTPMYYFNITASQIIRYFPIEHLTSPDLVRKAQFLRKLIR